MQKVTLRFSRVTILAVGGLLVFARLAEANNTVVLTQNPAYSFSDGGAFNAVTGGTLDQNYAPVATQGGGFQTFCIESTVTFYPNTSYYFDLSQQDSEGRALTMGAAYLYSQFATGTLPGYFTAADRSVEAGLLQSAIWELQYNQTLSGFPDFSTDPFYVMATNAFGGAAGALAPANGAYHVDVLQLWDSKTSQIPGTDDHQNQLVYLGVPDTASTGAMIGAMAVSLVWAARRQRKPAFAPLPIRSRK